MFAFRQTYGYFNIISNIVNKKTAKKQLFFLAAFFHSEILKNLRDSPLIAWRTQSKKGYILTE